MFSSVWREKRNKRKLFDIGEILNYRKFGLLSAQFYAFNHNKSRFLHRKMHCFLHNSALFYLHCFAFVSHLGKGRQAGSSPLFFDQVRFNGHDVILLGVNVSHGVPHQVHQDLVIFLVQLNVVDEERRKSKKWNPEWQAPRSSLIHDSPIRVKNTVTKKM